MLADYIRGFCALPESEFYEAYEHYSGRYMFGKETIGIIVKEGHNYFEMLMRLTRYFEEKGFDDPNLELEGMAIDELGLDVIVYFPAIRDYP